MAAGNESYEDLVGQILRPTSLTDLKDPIRYEKVSILVYRDSSSEEPSDELEFENIYPFYTIADLSTQIYIAMEEKEEFHPQNQCLLAESMAANKFYNFKYMFNKEKIIIDSPFTLIQSGGPNKTFVDIEGNPTKQDITSREFMLLDDVFFKKTTDSSSIYTLHLFLYSDVLLAYPGLRPINRVDWEGIFRVYFPEIDKDFEDGRLSEAVAAYAPTRVSRFKERQNSIEKLDQLLLEGAPLRKPGESTRGDAINFSNIRGLRFTWNPPKAVARYQPFRLESVFYDMRVSVNVPYIRYYPVSATPISKVHVEGPLNIPTLEDPSILQRWAQERPVLPEQEFISAKVLVRPGSGSVSPLYANLFLFQDGSAMFTIQPNANTKSLTRQGDLYNLVPILNSVMSSVPGLEPKLGNKLPTIPIYSPKSIQLSDAYVVLSLWLEKEDVMPITSKSLMRVLPYFRAFFQITSSPIEEQAPIAFLRYKCVNNFRTPSRDFQFLIRVSDLQKIQGATSLPSLVSLYKEEFDVSDDVAHSRVSTFLTDREKYSIVDPQTLEFTQKENPGIDIAIFGKHPYYTFHIYRVDSILTLRRIKTLLSLLISVEPEMFVDSQQSAQVLEEEEQEAEAVAEEEAEAEEEAVAEAEGQDAVANIKGEMKASVVASASQQEEEQTNAGMFNDDLGDFDGFGEEVEEAAVGGGGSAAASTAAVKTPTEVKAVPLKEDNPFPEQKALTAPPAPMAAKQEAQAKKPIKSAPTAPKKGDDEDDITDVSQIKLQPSRIYFRKRLQFYDKTLFSYAKTHPSLKKYPSMCAANALKQPTVMSEDEFARMKDIYSADMASGRVLFIEYPVKKGFPVPTPKTSKTEEITTLRYGSNLLPGQANIYICSEYWCIKDELVILKADFEGTVDRKNQPKDKNSCPFCRGGLITNRDVVSEGKTVIERIGKDKESGSKKHLFINFLNKTPHPLGLYLPCCFILKHNIQEDKEPAFKSLKDSAQRLASDPVVPALAASVAAAAQPVPFVPHLSKKDDVKIIPVNYKTALEAIKTTYIVGAEKLPLELTKAGPQIGIVPKTVDTYFTQDSLGTRDTPGLVVQTHTVWKLMIDNLTGEQNASGFFRLAAENNKRNQADSFLAAVAPYFTMNSAAELKAKILSVVQPNVFLSLNYGNFLFDFYNPNTPPPPPKILRDFATKRFHMPNSIGLSRETLVRAWKGFTAFEAFIKNTETLKEYRQFAQIFSTPNLLYWTEGGKQRMNGILFIVLEVGADGSVEVRCPPYGVSAAQTGEGGCDVAFILHYYSGVWEPLFYTHNDPVEGVFENTLIFTRDTRAAWPTIVEQRVGEYERMCHSSGLGMYTDSPFVESKTLLPISAAMTLEEAGVVEIQSIMRDTYNHVSAVIFKVDEELVIVPVVDDGTIYMSTLIELEWKTIAPNLANTTTAREFYTTRLAPLLDDSNRDTYEIVNLLRLDKTEPLRDFVYAFQLKGGLYVPVKKDASSEEESSLESTIDGSELPWSIDRKIAFGKTEPDVKLTMDYKEFEETFQHLRFTFSNWFSLSSPALKGQVNEILFFNGKPNPNLPLYEKRQRLLIILENEILSWLDSTIPLPSREPSLKRIDCRVAGESQCKDRCVWKGDANKCLLHVPTNFDVGSKQVPATSLLVRKLIEELIRFPEKRKQLLQQEVGQFVKIFAPFRSGNQYIVSEDLPAWSEMLRLSWLKKDEQKYIEEYSAISPLPEQAELAPIEEGVEAAPLLVEEEEEAEAVPLQEEEQEPIPSSEIPILESMFGGQYFFILGNSVTQILNGFGISNDEFEAINQTLDEEITDPEVATYVSKMSKYSFLQYTYTPGNPVANKPIIVKLQSPTNSNEISDVIIIVKLPDERVGLLSSNTEPTPIPFMNLTPSIKLKIKRIPTTLPEA